jgi:putative ABC transport system ATP-binding protein/lipoprotein-releasing system ATP-binding protein
VAVRGATFEIRRRDRIALVGPSGSGKSTLLHLIAHLDQPTGGSIEWPGLGPPETLRPGPVAMAFQGPSLLPPLTVQENVALPLLLLDEPEAFAMAAAESLLVRFGLEEVASKLPEEISGGQSQRAGLARALAGRPRLVLADEPTGQQDRGSGQALLTALLGAVMETDAALVIATHDARVAGQMHTRWSIRDGRLDRGMAASSR